MLNILNENTPRAFAIHATLSAIVVSIFLYVVFSMYLPWLTNHGDKALVPSVAGMTADEATKALAKNGLEAVVADSAFSPRLKPLSIIEQYPPANTDVKPGRKVYLTINQKSAPVLPLPNGMINGSLKNAQIMVQNAGFVVGQIKYVEYFAPVVLGVSVNGKEISAQALDQGVNLPKGTVVELIVGTGQSKELVQLPDLTGLPMDKVEDKLLNMGLRLGNITMVEAEGIVGSVMGQSPSPADSPSVQSGTKVNIMVIVGTENEE